MRILQLIDSLEAGGAERMAVNYANALSKKIEFSGLVATRLEGALKSQILKNVDYLFLEKKSKIDLVAVLKLRNYCQRNQVEIVHAHATSFFLASLLKIFLPSIKVIWHNHNGRSQNLSKIKIMILKFCSVSFQGIIVVNQLLKDWSQKNFKNATIVYLPNFVFVQSYKQIHIQLKGQDGSRIICLANLRAEKNHLLLLEVAKTISQKYPFWSFHLIGKDFGDTYSKSLQEFVVLNNLENAVFIYGTLNNIEGILEQGSIGVLSSDLEGLPVALIEYAQAEISVVVTAVGEIPNIIENYQNGLLVPPKDQNAFCEALESLILNKELRQNLGKALKNTVEKHYSEDVVIEQYLNWIAKC